MDRSRCTLEMDIGQLDMSNLYVLYITVSHMTFDELSTDLSQSPSLGLSMMSRTRNVTVALFDPVQFVPSTISSAVLLFDRFGMIEV